MFSLSNVPVVYQYSTNIISYIINIYRHICTNCTKCTTIFYNVCKNNITVLLNLSSVYSPIYTQKLGKIGTLGTVSLLLSKTTNFVWYTNVVQYQRGVRNG